MATDGGRGLQSAGLEPVDAPDFEHCTDAFDPGTGYGEVEIWVPVE
jgi:AraC family transcriptional regulator